MRLTVKSLLDGKAVTDEGSFAVKDLFYFPEDWSLRHALLNTGGWFDGDDVLVSTDRFGVPDGNHWPLAMTRAELDEAPLLDSMDKGTTSLPPLVVGPFGSTFSPLMVATQIGLLSRPDDIADGDTDVTTRDAQSRIFRMERVSDLLGAQAFGDHGPLGHVDDITLSESMSLTKFVMDDGSAIEIARLRRTADQGHLVFD